MLPGRGVLALCVLLGTVSVLLGCGALPPAAPTRQQEGRLRLDCQAIGITGAEDVAVHEAAGVAYISATDRRALFGQRHTGARPEHVGHLIRLDLKQSRPQPDPVTPPEFRDHVFQPHGLGLLPGSAGQRARLFVVNHRAPAGTLEQGRLHAVEILHLPDDGTGALAIHRRGITGPELTNPNDIAPVGGDAFYVTNTDDGESEPVVLLRSLLGRASGSLAFYDGDGFRPGPRRLPFANGLLADPGRQLLHVSSSSDGLLRSFSWREGHPARPVGERPTGFRADNIEFAPAALGGGLLVTGHPSAIGLALHRFGRAEAPSRVLRLPVGADGLPGEDVIIVYDSDGVETRNKAIAAASVMASWTPPGGGQTRYLIGAILSQRLLLCDPAP